jgi:hypothetical protein
VDGVVEALVHLERVGVRDCVASSSSHSRLRRTLGQTGLLSRFEGRISVPSWAQSSTAAPESSSGDVARRERKTGSFVYSRACAGISRAVARSPWLSWAHGPITPTGAMNSGEGRRRPNRSTDRSRSFAPTSIRGTRPHRPNAATLVRWVPSSPAPPATYERMAAGSAARAGASSSAYVIGSRGTTPRSPSR